MNVPAKKNTVILINPHYHPDWHYGVDTTSFPTGLLYLATALKIAGFRPVIVDACTETDHLNTIENTLADALFAGISAMTPQVPHAMELARRIRQQAPGLPIVWGGIHPTLYPDTVLNPFCDIAVLGEGDVTAVELAEALKTIQEHEQTEGRDVSFAAAIPGIAVEQDGKVVLGPRRNLVDVRTLPWIDYSLINAEKYIPAWSLQELRTVRVMPVPAARGCPWHCTFCINTTLNHERRYRCRSAGDLLDEIEYLVRTFNLETVMLSDEEFFADRERVETMLDGIEARGLSHIRFNATCRVNHFRDGYIDAAFLKRMKRCGFVNLVFGFESGSPDCLEIIRKEITVEQGLHAARLLASEGFMAVWGFIMAIPGETPRDLVKTLHVMEKIRSLSAGNYFIGPQIFRPYPGSELYRRAIEAGLNEPASLDEWGRQAFTGEGWIGSAELLWIPPEHRRLVDYINYIAPLHYNRRFIRSSGLKGLYHAVLRLVFRFRLAAGCWMFPVEHRLKKLPAALLGTLPPKPVRNISEISV